MKQFLSLFIKRCKWHYVLLFICLLYIFLTKSIPSWGAFYAHTLYIPIARLLFWFSSWFPFALGDLFIACSLLGTLFYPFYAHYRLQRKMWTIVRHVVLFLLWIYVWFYLAWGLNYYQPNFYERTGINSVAYNDTLLIGFAEKYIMELNASYVQPKSIDREKVSRLIQKSYEQLEENSGIHRPFHPQMRPKTMVFSSLASKVGVQGSMGPFFCEFTLNSALLPENYPFSVAHEMAHVLGITSEAEANFYAYLLCTSSSDRVLRYSGYYALLSYVLRNVQSALGNEAYHGLLSKVRPEILKAKAGEQQYWKDKYSPVIGSIQNYFYDFYLKQHRVDGGIKNYSYVIGLLLSYEQHQEELRKLS